jgi:hypothetical protein
MKTARYFLGCCLLLIAPTAALSDACTDLQASIAKATALRHEMQREAAPLLSTTQIPAHHQGVCTAAQNLRSHIITLLNLGDQKCLSEAQQKSLTISLDASMKDADSNIGLFCP